LKGACGTSDSFPSKRERAVLQHELQASDQNAKPNAETGLSGSGAESYIHRLLLLPNRCGCPTCSLSGVDDVDIESLGYMGADKIGHLDEDRHIAAMSGFANEYPRMANGKARRQAGPLTWPEVVGLYAAHGLDAGFP
jgi:hypothetical protein